MTQTDSDLLRRYVRHRDEPSFSELVQRHFGVVYNIALRRTNGNTVLAEEATQIVFTQVACKAQRLVNHTTLIGWLHVSVRYAASTLVRRERRLAARHETMAAMQLNESTEPNWDALRPFVDRALDHLDRDDRNAVLLRFFGKRSYAEIGADLRISENAARKRVNRAVDRLRAEFAQHGVTTTAAAIAAALAATPCVAAPAGLATSVASIALANAALAASVPAAGTMIASISLAKIGTAVAAVVFAALVGTAGYVWVLQQESSQQLSATEAAVARFHAELRVKARPGAKSSSAAHVVTLAPRNVPASAGGAWIGNAYQQMLLLQTSAKFAQFRDEDARLRFLNSYGAFISTRNYSPEKVTALERALVEYDHNYRLHQAQAMLSSNPGREIRATRAADEKELFDQLKPVFTEAEQQDIRRCFEAQKYMYAATDIGYQADFRGVPLDNVQKLALATIVADDANAAKALPADERKRRAATDPASGLNAGDRRMLEDAAVFLSAPQLQQMEEYLRLENLHSQLLDWANALYRKEHPAS